MPKEHKEDLLEWYGDMEHPQDERGVDMAYKIEPKQDDEESTEKEEKDSTEKTVDNIEKGAELHKAMAMVKALDNKLALMSGVFAGFEKDDKKEELKSQVKEIARRIQKIVDEL